MSAPQQNLVFWQNDQAQVIPNNAWTPIGWATFRAQRPNVQAWTQLDGSGLTGTGPFPTPGNVPKTTTIAAGSNGQTLPQGTINVASTADFLSSGYIGIIFGGAERLVKYTGKTATSFTGCTQPGAGTGGVMTTGDTVRQSLVVFRQPFPSIMSAVAECHWASNGVGVRGIRFRDVSSFNFELATTVIGAVATAGGPELHTQTTEQPAVGPGGGPPTLVEVFQNSGAALNILGSGGINFSSPRLVLVTISSYA